MGRPLKDDGSQQGSVPETVFEVKPYSTADEALHQTVQTRRPLEPLEFTVRPLAPHALAWSCDAELAVALADTIHIFIPEYPVDTILDDAEGMVESDEQAQPQFSLSLHISGLFRPEPSINAKVCADAGVPLEGVAASGGTDFVFAGVGSGLVSRSGAAVGQTVRLEWSPSGLGHNLRPVLGVLVTHGCILALGEHVDTTSTMVSYVTSRSFKHWQLLWGLGACLPIPDPTQPTGLREVDDKIVAFSWAGEVLSGRALLAYANDASEVVIVAVQLCAGAEASTKPEPIWKLGELARFDGRGPHKAMHPLDPHLLPLGSTFSLKWSPWLVTAGSRTAILAYMAHNHIGFRQITLTGEWVKGCNPTLQVGQTDSAAICLPLGADAFVEWEDAIWPESDGSQMARGIIATPWVARSFQVNVCTSPGPAPAAHTTQQCKMTYVSSDDEAGTNPITGLVVHRPLRDVKPATPQYTLVRLSATATNRDWFETNVAEEEAPLPQWAEYVRDQTRRLVPRVAAMRGIDSDSDSDDMEDEFAAAQVPMARVRPHRFRFWGLASSPGGSCSAVLVSKHSTQLPQRRPLSTLRFGWRRDPPPADGTGAVVLAGTTSLTTEARLWEAVYGRQGDICHIVPTALPAAGVVPPSPLRNLFAAVLSQQACVFCDARLVGSLAESTCESGHSFATCAASGLAIMAPGVSRRCALCGLRCLKTHELVALGRRHLGSHVVVDPPSDTCSACGGKFVTCPIASG